MRPNSKLALLICLGAVMAAVGFVILRHRDAAVVGQDACGQSAPSYWYDPMRPSVHFDRPGNSPFMDMPLVPKCSEPQSGVSAAGAVAATAESKP